MYCEKCKKDVEDGAKFCPRCGEKAVKKTEEVKETKAVKKEVKEESSGLGIAGMVIGIISLLLSFVAICESIWLVVYWVTPVVVTCSVESFTSAATATDIIAISNVMKISI